MVLLQEKGIDLEEFSSPFWSGNPPASHVNGNEFIVLGIKSKNLEVTQLLLLPWISSVGDHRSWIVEFTTRSMLGPYLLCVQKTLGRRLVTTNYKSLMKNNAIVKVKFEKHKILPCLNLLIKMSDKYCGSPPEWLVIKIQKFHREMDQLRLHAERKCRKT